MIYNNCTFSNYFLLVHLSTIKDIQEMEFKLTSLEKGLFDNVKRGAIADFSKLNEYSQKYN